MDGIFNIILLFVCLSLGLALGWFIFRKRDSTLQTQVHSSIEEMRAIGKLSVFKVVTKEIITETDHTFGEFGSKYLAWVLSHKKMAMIFEFEVNFSYNLQYSDFTITTDSTAKKSKIEMPVCEYAVAIRNLQFYDEKKAIFLPWLLPNLIGEAFGGSFTEQDKNRLIDNAKARAQDQAKVLIEEARTEVEQSAKNTLTALAHSFNIHSLELVFKRDDSVLPLPIKLSLEQTSDKQAA